MEHLLPGGDGFLIGEGFGFDAGDDDGHAGFRGGVQGNGTLVVTVQGDAHGVQHLGDGLAVGGQGVDLSVGHQMDRLTAQDRQVQAVGPLGGGIDVGPAQRHTGFLQDLVRVPGEGGVNDDLVPVVNHIGTLGCRRNHQRRSRQGRGDHGGGQTLQGGMAVQQGVGTVVHGDTSFCSLYTLVE